MSDNIIVLSERRKQPEGPAEMVAQITVYDNGDGTLWLADMVVHKAQFNWLLAKVAEVSSALVEEKGRRTGET